MSADAAREPVAPLIELRGIGKTYFGASGVNNVRVLQDVSLTIYAGEFVAIMGSSGSGKSTLMNLLGCLDRPCSGSYRFAGREVGTRQPDELAQLRRDTFGFVFQQYHLVQGLTAAENVEMPAVYGRLPRARRGVRAAALLAQLGLSQRGHHRPDQLSGGQQQRVSIARALMNGGRVLLADEPTGALDRASGLEVMNLLQQLSAAGHTIIIVTHDRAVARQARRTIELSDGRVVADSGNDTTSSGEPPQPHAQRDGARQALPSGVHEAVRTAFRALRVNVVRSLLTLLGIVVGVASVVALLAIGEGTKRAVLREMTSFGTNRLYILPGDGDPQRIGAGLTAVDAALVAQVPRVAAAMPSIRGNAVVRYGNVDHESTVFAVTSDFSRILNWKITRGSYFQPEDERSLATVGLIGPKLAQTLFGGEDPLRHFVLVDNVPFQIIGVLESKGAVSGDRDDDNALIIPFTTGSQRLFGTPYASWISVSMTDSEHSKSTVAAIEAALSDARHMKDFSVFNQAAMIAARSKTLDIMTTLLAVTAAISLLVGGIGVMNIMLMTVAERTSEIGIRIAVGATRGDVLTQFLTEAVVLASLGGVLGLGLGWGLGVLGRAFEMKVVFTVSAAAAAFVCAVTTGLVSGYLPARRAARMDPVVALARQ